MKILRTRIVVTSVLVIGLSLGLTGAPRAVETIELPAEPPTRRTVALKEQWRIGEDEEDILLGVITFGLLDDAGQVALVDRQLSQVLIIGPTGELVTILGREGEGPGELNEPHALVPLDDGAIGVVQGFPGRIIGLNADGTPRGDIDFGGSEDGGFSFVRECTRSGDSFVAYTGRMVFDTATGKVQNTSTLAVYTLAGTQSALIAEHTQDSDLNRQVYDEAAEFSEMQEWAVSPNGLVYTTPVRDGFDLLVRDLKGVPLHQLHRPFTPRQRTKADRNEIGSGVRMVVSGQRVEVENKALATDPAIRDLAVARDGRLFVTNCFNYRKLLPAGTAARYDVIRPDGTYVEELTLTVPGFDGTQDVLFFLDGEHFLVFKNFDAASATMDDEGGLAENEDGEAAPLSVIFLTI